MKTIKLIMLMLTIASLNLSFVDSFFTSFEMVKLNDDPVDDECGTEIDFNSNIQPILKTNCTSAGCHIGDGPMRGIFTDYESVMNYIKADGEFRIRLIERKDMPPAYSPGKTSLSDEDLLSISCWIKQGYPS